jgi:hypothetical protein
LLKFLGNEDTWRELRAASRHRAHPLFIAVPFLGNGGGKLLSLKQGDALVVALTKANSINGSVCPAEIERLQAKGVQVFLAPRLHAKVLLCGQTAIVGSANLSQTSSTHLDEAAILTTDASVVRHIRAWFQQRTLEPVSPEWLAICAKVYRPPKGGFGRTGERTTHPTENALWLLGVTHVDYPEDEAAISQSGASRAKKKLSDPAKFKVETIRWRGKLARMREGDTVIQIMKGSRSRYVEELARLIGFRRTNSRRRTPVAYLYLECRNHPKRISWEKFQKGCSEYGLKIGESTHLRRVTSPAQTAKLLALVSSQDAKGITSKRV